MAQVWLSSLTDSIFGGFSRFNNLPLGPSRDDISHRDYAALNLAGSTVLIRKLRPALHAGSPVFLEDRAYLRRIEIDDVDRLDAYGLLVWHPPKRWEIRFALTHDNQSTISNPVDNSAPEKHPSR